MVQGVRGAGMGGARKSPKRLLGIEGLGTYHSRVLVDSWCDESEGVWAWSIWCMHSKHLLSFGGLTRNGMAGLYESGLMGDPGLYEGLGSGPPSFGSGPWCAGSQPM